MKNSQKDTHKNNKNSKVNNKVLKVNENKKVVKPLPPPTYITNYYKSTIGIFSKIYGNNSMKWRISVAIIVGLLMSFVSLLFVQNTGLYVSGTSGMFQAIARIVKLGLAHNKVVTDTNTLNIIYQLLFYCLYLFANIPLIIFSWKKMGKNFTILATIVLVISSIVPLIFNQIPEIDGVFIFGNTTNGNTDLYLLNFENNSNLAFSMFLYAFFAGLINGLAVTMVAAVGGCSGGLDFVSFYFAYRKRKPIGKMLLIFNSCSIIFSATLGSFIAGGVADSSNWTFYNFLSINLMSGIIYALICVLVLNHLFPKDKVVKIQIYCEDVMTIRNYLYSINFNHSLTINTTIGGYSLQPKKNIEIICLYIEVPKIIRSLKEVKKDMMITVTPIKGIDGKLSVEQALN